MVLYEGPSMIDGTPIVAIATGKSSNSKTGNMVQVFILRQDVHPTEALATGADAGICGECPHRPTLGGSCYVVVAQSPSSVWNAYKRGIYPTYDADTTAQKVTGRMVRLGAYGDPAAVPFEVWSNLLRYTAGNTGYTHQWRKCDQRFADLVMASCDGPTDLTDARSAGYRCFYVTPHGTLPERGTVHCPASEERGKKLQCIDCRHCNGTQDGRRSDVMIWAHGAKSGKFTPTA